MKKKFPEEHNFYNSVFAFFLWITAGLLYPFYFSTDNRHIQYFQGLSTLIICLYTPFILFLILFYQYIKVKRNPVIKKRRNIDNFLNEYDIRNEGKNHTFKNDVYRKGLHLLPAGAIILLWIFGIHIWAGLWNHDQILGISGEDYARFLILTVGFSGIIVFAIMDFVRLSYIFEGRSIYHILPDRINEMLCKTMKRGEIFEFTKPALLTLAMTPIFFLPFGIFTAAALIATIGDAAASLFGKKYGGNHHFPKKSNKTIIGYIAGFIVSFIVAMLSLWIFEPHLSIIKIVIIACAGALIFLITDLLSLKIDDNMLNPLLCGFVMALLFFLI